MSYTSYPNAAISEGHLPALAYPGLVALEEQARSYSGANVKSLEYKS